MSTDPIKMAMHARNYGASELMLATTTGRYPPPHEEMDKLMEKYQCSNDSGTSPA